MERRIFLKQAAITAASLASAHNMKDSARFGGLSRETRSSFTLSLRATYLNVCESEPTNIVSFCSRL